MTEASLQVAALTILSGFAFAVLQLILARTCGKPQPIGDERDYIRRSALQDPHFPELYIRMPLVPSLARYLYQKTGSAEGPLRMVSLAASFVLLVLLVFYSASSWGLPVGMMVAILLLAQAEWLILSRHIWPECLLSLTSGLLVLLLHQGSCSWLQISLLGIVVAFAFSIRFEQIVLLPGVVLSWFHSGYSFTPEALIVLSFPTLALALGLTCRNALKYRIPWPDTTWRFNLRVAAAENESFKRGQEVSINSLVQDIAQTAKSEELSGHKEGLSSLFEISFVPQVLARFKSILGPDTFVSQRLFPPKGAAYPSSLSPPLALCLKWSFPCLASMAFWLTVYSRALPSWSWPFLMLALACCVAHTRTRYRLPLIGPLALFVGSRLGRLLSVGDLLSLAIVLLLSVFLSSVLVASPGRQE